MSISLPQPLTGSEFVSIKYQRDGREVWRGMRLSELLAHIAVSAPELWIESLPTSLPTTAGVAWNNGGVISIA